MSDRSKSGIGPAVPVADPRMRNLRALTGNMCQAADLAILSAVFLGIATLPALTHGLAGLLELRESVRNLLIGAMCVSTWRMILMSVGVYDRSRTGSLADYIFRCLIALNSCTAVVGLVEAVVKRGSDAWRAVEIFWVASLIAMTLLRVVLILFDRMRRQPFG